MKLIIVESPHKSTTISKFLPKDYQVVASKGHIRDLASTGKMGLGVDINNNFKPTYIISMDKQKIVDELKKDVAKADEVFLATDPDREGEAIAWHLAQVLNLDVKTTKRLEFHEVTKQAVIKAIDNPRTIDLNLVESQETRRIIDRLMGYRLSNLLQSKIKSRSAGRVQSVVLRSIVDREHEISSFVPKEYWSITSTFKTMNKEVFTADLQKYNNANIEINSKENVDKIIASLSGKGKVISVKKEMKSREPNPPFTTATLQQSSFINNHFSTKKTSSIAQRLYEGVVINGNETGLITYIRTDSTRLADEFVSDAFAFIESKYGKDYVGKIHQQKKKNTIQDAHEAIRPTNISLTPESIKSQLDKDSYLLYKLIFDRTIASLMSQKTDETTTIEIEDNNYLFTTSSTKNVFDGYSIVTKQYEEKKDEKVLPSINENDIVECIDNKPEQHFTKPPVRYNEGKLVKLMQDNGIGRPSTYSPTISTLQDREYVVNEKSSLVPTSQGEITVEKLVEFFPKYMDNKYTAQMEEDLDLISVGEYDKNKLLSDFWSEFVKLFDNAYSNMEKVKPEQIDRPCPKCGSPLVKRKGKYGEFIGCSNYPACVYIEQEKKEVQISERICKKCGGHLILRKSKKGEFYGCENFPNCNYMEDIKGKEIEIKAKEPVVIPDDAPICPQCKTGKLIEKKSRYGKTFIGCSNYPKCHYIQKEKKES